MLKNSGWPSLTSVIHGRIKANSKKGGMGFQTLAELLPGKPYATLMSEFTQQEGHKFGADLVLPVMELTGDHYPMIWLARELGGSFIPLPALEACPRQDAVSALSSTIKEFGEFAAETAKDIVDGELPAEQLGRIEKEADEAVEAILAMKALARAIHEKQYGGRK